MLSVAVQAATVVACGLGRALPSPLSFYVVTGLYLVYGVALGLAMPVKQAYLNAHIPSAQRATIISLDSMLASSGGVAGQAGGGWLARARSIGEAWAGGGAPLLLALPLFLVSPQRRPPPGAVTPRELSSPPARGRPRVPFPRRG